MEIEIENTKEDYSEFYKYYYFKRTIVFRIFFSIGVAYIFFGGERNETKVDYNKPEHIPVVLLVGAIVFIVITLLPYFITMRRLAKSVGTNKSPEGIKKFTVTDRGIQVDTPRENVFWNWESIKSGHLSEKFLYIILYNHRAYILPARYFGSDKDMSTFLGTLQNRSTRVRSFSPQRKAYLLYWWGLLGLIPFIGAIAGLVILLRGIFEFKDKYLIIIGSACILYTVGFYSLAFPSLDEAEKKGGGFVGFAQMELNTLMKNVEFYKIQHGVYPDSLEQVTKDAGMAWNSDPLQTRKGKKNNKYNYGKVGDKYYLFSSGRDGIPGTADDIYPKIAEFDSSKFGLIRKP